MTELNSIKAGDRVLVKIGRNLIECEALAVGPDGVTVRSLSTGREFTTARVEEVAGRAEPNPPAPVCELVYAVWGTPFRQGELLIHDLMEGAAT